MARNRAAEDMACTCINLKVEKGGVEEDVGGMVEGKGSGAVDVEFLCQEMRRRGQRAEVSSAESSIIGMPGCVRRGETSLPVAQWICFQDAETSLIATLHIPRHRHEAMEEKSTRQGV